MLAFPVVRGILLGREAASAGERNKRRPCGCSSVVERHVANVNVGRSNRLTRFQTKKPLSRICDGGFSMVVLTL